MINFIVGAMVGGCVSVFFFALLIAGRDEKSKKQIRAEVIKELKNKSQWISVKDKLPEESGEYLCVWDKYIDVFEFAKDLYEVDKYAFYDRKGKSGFYNYHSEWGNSEFENITHWQPLPELPKKE